MAVDGGTLELQRARLGYRGRTVFEELSLRFGTGRMAGIAGPNGSGKSTLLKALSGLLPPGAGRVTLDGRDLSGLSRRSLSRQVAVVPQAPTLPEAFTVTEIVLMGRYSHLGPWRNEGPRDLVVARRAMRRTGVEHLADRRMGEVSGGERQRVLIARALAQEPRFLLLDEPTAHLDLQYQFEALELARALADGGMAVIAALHDFSLAGRFCDRLVLLGDGAVRADGTPREVITPANIERVFGVVAFVYSDLAAGPLVVHAGVSRAGGPAGAGSPAGARGGTPGGTGGAVHVIGGGGSALPVLRLLRLEGYRLSVGVLNEGDTDLSAARALGLPAVAVPPFAPVDEAAHRRNAELAAAADVCVLAPVAFGSGNLRNLEAAQAARRLVLMAEPPIVERDFTGGRATEMFARLAERATVTDLAGLAAAVARLCAGKDSN